ncbi:quinoprotein dehydrogenase-associated SoxYZ-like carrier [uncultured Roseovarius sp.]|uniref:quinoprotein dehydrogenase-associated SoxYZ-like carrier n=1 Tax=uncultured Roseovarius sp. TaxID=293344 RepID=UPI002633396E|nr:quinoprotein dehydrogenase-associated SoxYZ-like carrier [uncultured Roseovarius sp.]
MKRAMLALAAVIMISANGPARAQSAWPDIQDALFGDAPVIAHSTQVRLDAPYRATDDARTALGGHVTAPPGQKITTVMLMIDENPAPVAAEFQLAEPRSEFAFSLTTRINGQTPLHLVALTDAGERHMAEAYLKTSGQGACAAPPGTNPEDALATLGDMELAFLPALDAPSKSVNTRLAALAGKVTALDVDISHPSHSGLAMDQITLLYVPMRVVDEVAISLDNAPYVTMTGSISLSENPRLRVSIPDGVSTAEVMLRDTDGTISHARTSLAAY